MTVIELENKKEMQIQEPSETVDNVTRVIGSWGRWQLIIIFWSSFINVFAAWHIFLNNFFTPNADHWCKPPEVANWTTDVWKQYAIPPDEKQASGLSQCKMYDRNYSIIPDVQILANASANLSVVDCMYGWDYDRSSFHTSLENEYDLVCTREVLAKTKSSTYMVGVLAGVLVFGQLADIFGRKVIIFWSLLMCMVGAIATIFVPSFEVFLCTRFFVAMGLSGCAMIAYVFGMEFVDKRARSVYGILAVLPWCTGYIMLPGIAYLIPNWRHLQAVLTALTATYFLYWWFVPKSIRWLLTKGRTEEATEIAKEFVRKNRRNVDVDLSCMKTENGPKNTHTFIDLFRYPVLRKKTLVQYVIWFVNAFVYYGLSLGTSTIGGNIFITFFISGAIELPAAFIGAYAIVKIGRKKSLCISMIVGGIACIATAAFERGVYPNDWPIVTLAILGKFGISSSFNIIYVYAVEIFPTPVRNIGVGSCSVVARFGGIVAPYVELLRNVHPAVPLALFGVTSVAAGILTLVLPETNNKPLPQTLQDAEKC